MHRKHIFRVRVTNHQIRYSEVALTAITFALLGLSCGGMLAYAHVVKAFDRCQVVPFTGGRGSHCYQAQEPPAVD